MSNFKRSVKRLVIGLFIAVIGISCNSNGGSGNTSITPSEVSAAALAVQDVSVLDLAQLGLTAPSPMIAGRGTSSAAVTPADTINDDDPRWFLFIHPLRHRGQDDHFPRIIEPLILARYVVKTNPAGVTITPAGACPATLGSDCTYAISFGSVGTSITATVGTIPIPLTFSGTLTMVTHVIQDSPLQFSATVTTTDLKIAGPAGSWVRYVGVIEEDYDGTGSPNFTLTQKSGLPNPMTLTTNTNNVLSVTGVRTVAVQPQIQVTINSSGKLTVTKPDLTSTALSITSAKTATKSGLALNLTLDRTVDTTGGNSYHRTATLTLTALNGPPVTSALLSGTENFTGPSGTVTTALNNVELDLFCFVPVGGTISITIPGKIITVIFSSSCSCMAMWSDNDGNSGFTDFCWRIDNN